jgi:hypothetical protein
MRFHVELGKCRITVFYVVKYLCFEPSRRLVKSIGYKVFLPVFDILRHCGVLCYFLFLLIWQFFCFMRRFSGGCYAEEFLYDAIVRFDREQT